MQKIQLYIEGQRVDMFKDESVTLTQSIQNIKEIGKVFTDFTKTFSLPASKANNKIFKHYYNFDISGGFDARKKKKATIELNSLPFKDGKIKLEGVDLKNNKADTYRVTFFGSTVELKDLLGDDELSSLPDLVQYNTPYSALDVKNNLAVDQSVNDPSILAALITHTKRLFYNSKGGHAHDDLDSGNLHYDTGSAHNHGVSYTDLKYAIRVDRIIDAIEARYGFTFSDDFFHSTYAPYNNLFMWLHRKKGQVETLSGLPEAIINTFQTEAEDTATQTEMTTNSSLDIFGDPVRYNNTTELRFFTLSTEPYRVSLQKDGIEVLNISAVGNLVINQFTFDGLYTVYIQGETQIQFSNIEWYISYESSFKIYEIQASYLFTAAFEFIIPNQIPELKCIDFITGLFKMFNLTAYIAKNESQVTVKRLDDFYSGGTSFDITEYVDANKSAVNIALPYREISFTHGDTDTFLAKTHKEKYNKTWGRSEYNGGTKLDGGTYEIETPFSQLKYERILDVNGLDDPNAQCGYFVDDNQDPYFGKPLLFYPIKVSSVEGVSFRNTDTNHVKINDFNIPSNSVALNNTVSKYTMSFFDELNEYTGENGFTDTLFEANYKNYITNVFNSKNRITKITAYLPLRILLNYTLADRFVIKGNSYKINSITTNLEKGESKIELLNDL